MTIPCHPLFAGLGTLQRRTPEYFRIHASLVASYRESQGQRKTKRERALLKSKIFKQQGDISG